MHELSRPARGATPPLLPLPLPPLLLLPLLLLPLLLPPLLLLPPQLLLLPLLLRVWDIKAAVGRSPSAPNSLGAWCAHT